MEESGARVRDSGDPLISTPRNPSGFMKLLRRLQETIPCRHFSGQARVREICQNS